MGDWQGGGQEWSNYNQETDWGGAGHIQVGEETYHGWKLISGHIITSFIVDSHFKSMF